MIERAMLLCRGEEVESGDFAPGGALRRGNCILPRPPLAAHGRLSGISMSAQIETTSAFIGRNPSEPSHCQESAKRSLRERAPCLVVDFGSTPNLPEPGSKLSTTETTGAYAGQPKKAPQQQPRSRPRRPNPAHAKAGRAANLGPSLDGMLELRIVPEAKWLTIGAPCPNGCIGTTPEWRVQSTRRRDHIQIQ